MMVATAGVLGSYLINPVVLHGQDSPKTTVAFIHCSFISLKLSCVALSQMNYLPHPLREYITQSAH